MEILKALKKITSLMVFCPSFAVAELPPDIYDEYRKAAPEKIVIFISKLTSKHTQTQYSKITEISSIAKVSKVFRSESGLTEGQTIKINYQIEDYGKFFTGPSQPIHVETGKMYIAYLSEEYGFYIVSAGGQSFMSPETYQKYYSNEENQE